MDIEERVQKARKAHQEGYNCTQAVICGYIDLFEYPDEVIKMTYGTGGGIGLSREICGTLVGGAIVIGEKIGKKEPDAKHKKYVNDIVRKLCLEFESHHGSVVCGELLGIRETTKTVKKTPCRDMVEEVVRLLEKYVIE